MLRVSLNKIKFKLLHDESDRAGRHHNGEPSLTAI
jgi:hypothetical protein